MKNRLKYMMLLFVMIFTSCDSWLDVKPVDRISGRALFETRQGFVKALNGVYVELTDRSIYGREMTAGMMDIFGQYYTVNGTNNYFSCAIRYDFEDDTYGVKNRLDEMWRKAYNTIVNLNIIIEECGEDNNVLPGIWFGLIKGEALALRAFLHLDMLRIFGPMPTLDDNKLYIPYVTNTDQTISPLRSFTEIKQFLINDLTEAIALLKESDPIIENGRMFSDGADGDNSLRYRQYRMNYYAARALLARAYLWFGDRNDAYTTAKTLLADVGTTIFPFVSEDNATKTDNPDRVFSTEIMFSLYDNYRTTGVFDTRFSPLLESNQRYHLAYVGSEVWSGRISQLFITPNDVRYKAWITSYNPASGGVIHYISKYGGQTAGSNSMPGHLYMLPLIRISEVYLIVAECAIDLEEGKAYLSTVRAARKAYDLESVDTDALLVNIEGEYRREFLAEGQMFYFYKRLGKTVLPNGNNSDISQNLTIGQSQYIVPIPDSENDERVNN